MKIYLIEEHFDYEGFNIIGVYNRKDLADNHLQNVRLKKNGFADWYTMSEYTVNKVVKGY